jgi:hypothetical protein
MRNSSIFGLCIFGAMAFFGAQFFYTFGFYEEPISKSDVVSQYFLARFLITCWPSLLFNIWPGENFYLQAKTFLLTNEIPAIAIPVNIIGYALIGFAVGLVVVAIRSGKRKRK